MTYTVSSGTLNPTQLNSILRNWNYLDVLNYSLTLVYNFVVQVLPILGVISYQYLNTV